MTFRPPLVLRITGWVVAVGGLFFLIAGVLFLSGGVRGGRVGHGDAVLMAATGGVLTVVGLFIALRSSVVLHLGATSLWYRKFLFVRGSMTYAGIADITLMPGPARSVRIRDRDGHTVAINAFSVNWDPIRTWAVDHGRTDIVESLS
ncbi:hypothetical protein [Sciscionella sediminilitoris]|uniref:hypothetical protein n=1 Tax=Sciscionella sediminilitoris TaxID=1445613 RepID=UPI0004DEE247|nr:hypothetical protein [Sciscionella sp. SE31]